MTSDQWKLTDSRDICAISGIVTRNLPANLWYLASETALLKGTSVFSLLAHLVARERVGMDLWHEEDKLSMIANVGTAVHSCCKDHHLCHIRDEAPCNHRP